MIQNIRYTSKKLSAFFILRSAKNDYSSPNDEKLILCFYSPENIKSIEYSKSKNLAKDFALIISDFNLQMTEINITLIYEISDSIHNSITVVRCTDIILIVEMCK